MFGKMGWPCEESDRAKGSLSMELVEVGDRRPKMNGGRELGETSIAVVEVLVFWLEGLLLYLILWEMGSLLFLTS